MYLKKKRKKHPSILYSASIEIVLLKRGWLFVTLAVHLEVSDELEWTVAWAFPSSKKNLLFKDKNHLISIFSHFLSHKMFIIYFNPLLCHPLYLSSQIFFFFFFFFFFSNVWLVYVRTKLLLDFNPIGS